MLTIPPVTGRARGRRAVQPALTAAVTVATASLLTACGTVHASQPRSTASSTASGHQTPQAGSGSSSSPTAPSTVPGMAGLAVCQPGALKVALDATQEGGAAGSVYYPVNFTNTSDTPCGLYGYPGMSFVTAAGSIGHQIGATAQRNPDWRPGSAPRREHLPTVARRGAPGASAAARTRRCERPRWPRTHAWSLTSSGPPPKATRIRRSAGPRSAR